MFRWDSIDVHLWFVLDGDEPSFVSNHRGRCFRGLDFGVSDEDESTDHVEHDPGQPDSERLLARLEVHEGEDQEDEWNDDGEDPPEDALLECIDQYPDGPDGGQYEAHDKNES